MMHGSYASQGFSLGDETLIAVDSPFFQQATQFRIALQKNANRLLQISR